MDSERNSDLATLSVEYRYINSSSIGKEGRFEECITVRFRLSDTILNFMLHLFTSFNGLQKSSMARPLHLLKRKTLHLRRGKRERRLDDDHKDSSLTDCGVVDGDCLVFRGYTPLSKKTYNFNLEVIGPDDTRVHVSVTNIANIETLKHKLQNATGIHISEIVLSQRDKVINQSKTAVGFYSGRKELLRMVQVKKCVQEIPTIESNIDGELIMHKIPTCMYFSFVTRPL